MFCFFCVCHFSSVQEVDPLYIAYADMMAKVFLPFGFFFVKTWAKFTVKDFTHEWRQKQGVVMKWNGSFQSCAEDEEEEEEEGKEKTFEVEVRFLNLCAGDKRQEWFTVKEIMHGRCMAEILLLYCLEWLKSSLLQHTSQSSKRTPVHL